MYFHHTAIKKELIPNQYLSCMSALEFHHLDPKQKDFSISQQKLKNLDELKLECDKCILVCSNCHREIHAGIIQI